MNCAASSTARPAPSGLFRSRPSWPPCSGDICASWEPTGMSGCSAAPAAAWSAKASMARLAHRLSGRARPSPGGHSTGPPPYDLRHAALSLWLTASNAPAEIAARAGNSFHVLQTVCAHCIDGHGKIVSQQIAHALYIGDPSLPVPASGSPNRYQRPQFLSAICPWKAHASRHGTGRSAGRPAPTFRPLRGVHAGQLNNSADYGTAGTTRTGPRMAHSGLRNRSFPALEPLTPSRVSGSELGVCVAGVGFEPT
jgi:hypothetical protein